MERQQIHIAGLTEPQSAHDMAEPDRFIKTLQAAVLLSLLKRGQLSKRQFDLCWEKLHGEEVHPSV